MVNRVMLSCIFSIFWIFLHTIQAKNILIVPLYGEGSHYFCMTKIAMELINRGYNVTMLISRNYEEDANSSDKPFNFEFFEPTFTKAEIHDILKDMSRGCLTGNHSTCLAYALKLFGFDCSQRRIPGCINILNDAELLSKLKQSSFDLSVVDAVLRCPILQYLWQHTGLPYVVISPMLSTPSDFFLKKLLPIDPSYMSEPTTVTDRKMSFLGRIANSALSLFTWLMTGILSAFAYPFQSALPGDVSLLHPNAEMCFINTHFVLEFPSTPLMPNSVPVGGLTTWPAQSLDHEWEDFLQSDGKYGVVLVAMGTYIRGMDEDIAAIFAEAFAQLPQKVIWALRDKTAVTLPPNVKSVDWIPQNDLLGHPQIKVFVHHCGAHGLWEAVYHGVPMVGIPLVSDEPYNAKRMVSSGMGVKVNITTLTSDALAEAIRKVVDDPRYKRNAKRLSAIFRDTPRTPVQVVGDWLEYVIRRSDEKRLPSATLDLEIFKYLPLDMTFVFVVTFIICYHLILLMKTILTRL